MKQLPPPLPVGAAPYGTLLCVECHALAARKQRRGGLAACSVCGGRTRVHKNEPAAAPAVKLVVEGMTPPPSRRPFERGFPKQSPLEMWDAAHECSHGKLPHQPCVPCSRGGVSAAYPGIQVMVELERAA